MLGPFYPSDQVDTTVEVRPDDCTDLNGIFTLGRCRTFDRTTQILAALHWILIHLVLRPIWSYDQSYA